MCENVKKSGTSDPAMSLASIMRKDLGVEVSSAQLRLFILARWDRIKILAHAIHDEADCR